MQPPMRKTAGSGRYLGNLEVQEDTLARVAGELRCCLEVAGTNSVHRFHLEAPLETLNENIVEPDRL